MTAREDEDFKTYDEEVIRRTIISHMLRSMESNLRGNMILYATITDASSKESISSVVHFLTNLKYRLAFSAITDEAYFINEYENLRPQRSDKNVRGFVLRVRDLYLEIMFSKISKFPLPKSEQVMIHYKVIPFISRAINQEISNYLGMPLDAVEKLCTILDALSVLEFKKYPNHEINVFDIENLIPKKPRKITIKKTANGSAVLDEAYFTDKYEKLKPEISDKTLHGFVLRAQALYQDIVSHNFAKFPLPTSEQMVIYYKVKPFIGRAVHYEILDYLGTPVGDIEQFSSLLKALSARESIKYPDHDINIYAIENIIPKKQKKTAPKKSMKGCSCGHPRRCCRGCGYEEHSTWTCTGISSTDKCEDFKPLINEQWENVVTNAYEVHKKFKPTSRRGPITINIK